LQQSLYIELAEKRLVTAKLAISPDWERSYHFTLLLAGISMSFVALFGNGKKADRAILNSKISGKSGDCACEFALMAGE